MKIAVAVAGIVPHRRRQVGQRGLELVAELPQHGAHHAHLGRRFGFVPPWRQSRLRVTDVTRVAFGRRGLEVTAGQSHGGARIGGLCTPTVAKFAQFALAWVGGSGRQALQHLLVGAGGEGGRLGGAAQGRGGKEPSGKDSAHRTHRQ